ncbi:hypothetical protein [Desulfitobacterium chlororespirans]|uniref:Uncharacterized protein n=1 Tax=Desulfitobacterium chlororespirans DSM 11544 TaxID=1121395 RepID=A0A1M7UYJ0_9FIRM|nr:hypothetical protein [Desulfitobacterium chlororespirans]SHN87986.1 hypothetical protein SAMN02745215_05067 [Desulfitobacterium chlororespirans DSM 11544]
MTEREQQEQEIATIRDREVKLRLSDADVLRLSEKAGIAGLTIGELLTSFIGDLVYGTYANGSDERMYANQWFDRCWFGMFPDKTFLRYLLEGDELSGILFNEQDIEQGKEWLAEMEAFPDKDSDAQEEIAGLKADIAFWQKNIDDTFACFAEWCGDPHRTLDEEMKKVREWKNSYNSMIGK